MKEILGKIVRGAKIATGRQLSADQMAHAAPARKGWIVKINSADGRTEDVIEKRDDGTFFREKISYTWTSTPDFSYGSEIMHTGFYPDKTTVSRYDADGKLVARDIGYGGLANPSFQHPSHRIFNPAGSWLAEGALRRGATRMGLAAILVGSCLGPLTFCHRPTQKENQVTSGVLNDTPSAYQTYEGKNDESK